MFAAHQRRYLSQLTQSLWKFQQQDIFCDVTLVAQGDVEICAHSAVLGAVSAKLCAQMHAYKRSQVEPEGLEEHTEPRDGCKQYRLIFSNCEQEVLTAILRYMYTGEEGALMSSWKHPEDDSITLDEVLEQFGLDIPSVHIFRVAPEQDCVASDSKMDSNRPLPDQRNSERKFTQHSELNSLSERKLEINPINKSRIGVVSVWNSPPMKVINKSQKVSGMHIKGSRLRKSTRVPKPVTKFSDSVHSQVGDAVSNFKIKEERMDKEFDDNETDVEITFDVKSELPNVYECSQCLRKFTHKALMVLCAHDDAKNALLMNQSDALDAEARLACGLLYSRNSTHGSKAELNASTSCNDDDGEFVNSGESSEFEDNAEEDNFDDSDDTVTTVISCEKCGEVFSSDVQLEEHSISAHGAFQQVKIKTPDEIITENGATKSRPFPCTKCDRSFVLPANLARHATTHRRDGETVVKVRKMGVHICKWCNKVFRCVSHLKGHEHIHDGIKAFVCDVCGKGFIANSSLTKHMKKHTGERPFACSICDKRFVQQSTVKIHEKIHTGLKNYVCSVVM